MNTTVHAQIPAGVIVEQNGILVIADITNVTTRCILKNWTVDQYEQIIDESDYIAQKLIYQYRNVTTGYKKLTISEVTRTPFVKRLSPDCITGVILAFTIVATDTTNVC